MTEGCDGCDREWYSRGMLTWRNMVPADRYREVKSGKGHKHRNERPGPW